MLVATTLQSHHLHGLWDLNPSPGPLDKSRLSSSTAQLVASLTPGPPSPRPEAQLRTGLCWMVMGLSMSKRLFVDDDE